MTDLALPWTAGTARPRGASLRGPAAPHGPRRLPVRSPATPNSSRRVRGSRCMSMPVEELRAVDERPGKVGLSGTGGDDLQLLRGRGAGEDGEVERLDQLPAVADAADRLH